MYNNTDRIRKFSICNKQPNQNKNCNILIDGNKRIQYTPYFKIRQTLSAESKSEKRNHRVEKQNLKHEQSNEEEERTYLNERERKEKNGKKIWTISRFVRVILAQGPC